MSVNNNQHFVPQFYLRKFSNDGSSINLVTRKAGRVVKGASIKGQCSKRRLYGSGPFLDDFLTYLESNVSELIGVFGGQTPRFAPNQADVEKFLCFLTTQIYRTPKSNVIGEHFDKSFGDILARGSPEGYEFPDDIAGSRMTLERMCRMAIFFYPHLSDLMLVRVKAPKGCEFVTSDSPIILANKAGEQERLPNSLGLASSGLIITYPISPRFCLMLYDGGVYKFRHSSDMTVFSNSADVSKINRLQYLNCSESIYFKDERASDVSRLMRCFDERPDSLVELTEYISEGRSSDGEIYREFSDKTDMGHGTSSLVLFRQTGIEAKLNCSFISYRSRFQTYDSGSASGFFRNEYMTDLVEEYVAAMKTRKAQPFEFQKFVSSRRTPPRPFDRPY